jgi:hypothetical protein
MGGQQKNFISDIVFFQHQDGMRKKFEGIFYSVHSTVGVLRYVYLTRFRTYKILLDHPKTKTWEGRGPQTD